MLQVYFSQHKFFMKAYISYIYKLGIISQMSNKECC